VSDEEIRHLESITPFCKEGDYMDELLIERETDFAGGSVAGQESARSKWAAVAAIRRRY
jgi:hypothetical protein